MKVLIACEESQRISNEYRKRGIEAYSCDIIKCSGGHPEYHILSDALIAAKSGNLVILENGDSFITPIWDLMIAHPPCTYLSRAGSFRCNHDPIRLKKGFDAANFFLALWNLYIHRICLENPVPDKRFNLPKPSDLIQPYEFGDPFSKATYLWLKNLPPLFKTNILSWHESFIANCKRNTKERSKTFGGIAEAMAEQWIF